MCVCVCVCVRICLCIHIGLSHKNSAKDETLEICLSWKYFEPYKFASICKQVCLAAVRIGNSNGVNIKTSLGVTCQVRSRKHGIEIGTVSCQHRNSATLVWGRYVHRTCVYDAP